MFESIEECLYPAVVRINEVLSSNILMVLLLATGLWFTWKTRFVQIRFFKEGLSRVFGSLSFHGSKQGQGMSSFQALATSIAAQVGTGNIVGASSAILTGGPGAIFWMWVIAFFGMATIYAEATLAVKTRVRDGNGAYLGGPVYYIRQAFKGRTGRILSAFFAVAITLALGFMGCMVQANSIGSTMQTAFSIPSWIIGLFLVVICGFIFAGGVKRLASIVEKVVPVMALFFMAGGILILAVRCRWIPETFRMIFHYAFQPQAILGGSFGMALKCAVSQGAKRGLFSNEAGMGSTPHAHAQANVSHPHDQAVVAMTGVFLDTFVVLTLNALVIICTLYAGNGPVGQGILLETVNKTNMAQVAFGTVMGEGLGAAFVAVCLLFFAFSTILSWNMFGKINVVSLFGEKATGIYILLSLVFIFIGTLVSNDLVWELTDLFNNLMVIPNTLALFALSSVVVSSLKEKERPLR